MRVLLNVIKRENFVFFDPVNKIHLNRLTPIGEVTVLSDSLRRAIIAGSVIDIDNEFDIEISDRKKSINEALLKSFNIQPKVKEVVEVEEEVKEDKKEKPKKK